MRIAYDRSIWLVDMNMANIVEIMIDDEDGNVLIMPTWGLFELFNNERERGRDSRSPFMISIGPYRLDKKILVGWLAEVTVWTKDYPYPFLLRGAGADKLMHSVELKTVIDRIDLARIVGVDPDSLNDFITWTEKDVKE